MRPTKQRLAREVEKLKDTERAPVDTYDLGDVWRAALTDVDIPSGRFVPANESQRRFMRAWRTSRREDR